MNIGEVMYKALDVAKYIITYCFNQNKPISNLKLQKILYFLWVDFYKQTQKSLFKENICAWQLGPVVPEVYYEFCSYAGLPITKMFNLDSLINKEQQGTINNIIDKYIDSSAYSLVEKTHKVGTPWTLTYQDGIGARDIIPFDLIQRLECL